MKPIRGGKTNNINDNKTNICYMNTIIAMKWHLSGELMVRRWKLPLTAAGYPP